MSGWIMLVLVLGLVLSAVSAALADGPVERGNNPDGPSRTCRLPVEVSTGDSPRQDGVVELELDLAQAARKAGLAGAVDAASIVVTEVDAAGKPIGPACLHQFDAAAPAKDGEKSASGALVFLMPGTTAAKTTRHFQIHFGTGKQPATQATPLVKAQDDVDWQGQKSVKVETKGITWYYHKAGGGFASLIDADRNDWISYRAGGGSAGEYRGIPNMVHPEGYFHPGKVDGISRLVAAGPVRATIVSETKDKKWQVRWDIYPTFARLTVLKAAKAYWFLYEGTPGGTLDEDTDTWVLSDGRTGRAGEKWESPRGAISWVVFRDGKTGRSLCLARHAPDGDADSYWPMQKNMTVLGFGRKGLTASLKKAPAQFTVLLTDGGKPNEIGKTIEGITNDLRVAVGNAEVVVPD